MRSFNFSLIFTFVSNYLFSLGKFACCSSWPFLFCVKALKYLLFIYKKTNTMLNLRSWWLFSIVLKFFKSPNPLIWMCSHHGYGELFQAWEVWLSPHLEKPVGSKVGEQDPCPQTGSLMGNQACIVPRLLWDLLLLKLPHPEAANVYWVSLSSPNLS